MSIGPGLLSAEKTDTTEVRVTIGRLLPDHDARCENTSGIMIVAEASMGYLWLTVDAAVTQQRGSPAPPGPLRGQMTCQ